MGETAASDALTAVHPDAVAAALFEHGGLPPPLIAVCHAGA